MKGILWIFISLTVSTIPNFGQEGIYYYGPNSRPVELKRDALMFQEVSKHSENKYIIVTYIKQGEDWNRFKKEKIKVKKNAYQKISFYAENFLPKRVHRSMEQLGHGIYSFKESTPSGTQRTGTTTRYLPLSLEGVVTSYYKNGRIQSISTYRENQLISNENWLEDGMKYIDSVFYSVDEPPLYQMGDSFFKAYVASKLAESQLDLTEIEDEVVLAWVVMETGQIEGVYAPKGRSLQLNEYLVSALKDMPGKWTPAMLEGSPVRYFVTFPLNFIHNNAKFQQVEITSGMLHYNQY